MNIDALRKLSCADEPSEWRVSRVHDHRDVVSGREYLVEFPGLGDKRQFCWEAEAKLLQTLGNDESLVAYDRLRDAERRVVAVPVMRDDAALAAHALVVTPPKRRPGRPKKSVHFAGPPDELEEEDEKEDLVLDDGVIVVPVASVPGRVRPARSRRGSRKVRDNAALGAAVVTSPFQ